MREEDVKIGMKVIIKQKSFYRGNGFPFTFEQWQQRVRKFDFYIVGGIDYISHPNFGTMDKVYIIEGDYFLASDFEPYQPEPNKIPFTVIMPL